MIDDAIIRQIFECWAASENPRFGDGIQRPVPSFHDVKDVFEQVFLASLKCEEGRPVRCALVLASPSDIDDPSHQYNKDFRRFVTPLPVTAESIAKLAPAFDPRLSSIAVCRDVATSTLQCWGIFNYSPPAHRLNEPSPAPVEDRWCRPDLFTLTTRNPGSIQVSRMNSNIGWFTDGEFVPAVPTPFTAKSLGHHLMEPLKSTSLWQEYGTYYWQCYRAALEVLLFESASRGHGAIIILLASGDTVIPAHILGRVPLRSRDALAHAPGDDASSAETAPPLLWPITPRTSATAGSAVNGRWRIDTHAGTRINRVRSQAACPA